MNKCWPCEINDYPRKRSGFTYGRLSSFPQCGHGDRSLDCIQYERCLDIAIKDGWHSFHCESCTYDQRGRTNFLWEQFGPIIEDDIDPNGEEFFEIDPADLQLGIEYGRLGLETVLVAIIEEWVMDDGSKDQ